MGSVVLFLTVVSTSLLLGLLPGLVGGLRRPVMDRLGLAESALVRLEKACSLLLIPLLPLAGLVVDYEGVQEILFAGVLLAAIGFTLIGLAQNLQTVVLGYLALTAAGAALTPATVLLMPHAFWTAEGPHRFAAINLGFGFVALGLLLASPLIHEIRQYFGLRQTFLGLALLCLIPAACVPLTGDAFPAPRRASPGFILHEPNLWLVGVAVLFYFLLERSLEHWAVPYLEHVNQPGSSTRGLMLGFWLAFIVVRFLQGLLVVEGYELWAVLGLVLLSAVILGNMLGAAAPSSGRLSFCIVGGCYGPIFPTLLAATLVLVPRGQATAIGWLLAIGYLHDVTVKPLMGRFARTHTWKEVLWLPIVFTICLAASLLLLAFLFE